MTKRKTESNRADEYQLPEGWEWRTAENIKKILENGGRPRGGARAEGIPSIGGGELSNNGGFNYPVNVFIPTEYYKTMKRGKIEVGDVLIVKDGATTGKTSFVGKKFKYKEAAVNEHVFRYRAKNNEVLQKWVFWHMFSNLGQKLFQENFKGSAQGGINLGFAANYPIPLPPLPEQRRIVGILDDLVGKAQKALELRKQAVEKAEAVLDSARNKYFNYQKPRINIGRSELSYNVESRNPKLKPNEVIQYLDIGNIEGGTGNIQDIKTYKGDKAPSRARRVIRTGDVALSTVRPYLKAFCIIPEELDDCYGSTGLAVFKNDGTFYPSYLLHQFFSPFFIEQCSNKMRGSSYPALNNKDIDSLEVVLVSLEKQSYISNYES